jgi:hypothetical protein
MAAGTTAIKQRIVDLMIANSDHDSVLVFFQGVPYRVPIQYYPFCMVAIINEATEGRTTGNRHQRVYQGVIEFEAILQDNYTVTTRQAIIPSSATVDTLVNATIELFKTAANQRLNALTFTGGAVDEFIIGEQAEYGIEPATDREDSLNNFGIVPFVCRTWETFS